MKLTFGRFQGWDTGDLARTTEGRDYLAWGMENLKSPQWRKEFQAALDIPKDFDVALETKMILATDATIDGNDAEMLARETISGQLEADQMAMEFETAQANLIVNLQKAGVPAAHIKKVVSLVIAQDFDRAIDRGDIKFSSKEREHDIRSAAAQFEIEMGY